MKKKALALLMVTAMSASMLAGCGSGESAEAPAETAAENEAEETTEEAAEPAEDAAAEDTEAPAADKVYNIGICQLLENPALDAATQGFEDALTELLGEGNVNFDFQNAQGEQTNCATICTQFVTDGDDLILANATAPLH